MLDCQVIKSSKELEELKNEYNALLQYNHTNFLVLEMLISQIKFMAEMESLQNSIEKIESMMIDSADKQDFKTYKEQESQLSELKNKKEFTQADTDFIVGDC